MNILIDNKAVSFTEKDLPLLISGADKTGTSFFSICLLANLLKNGNKVLLFSAYPAAKEEFRNQVGDNLENAIIIESGEEVDLLETLKNIPDLSQRIVLIKNIENYNLALFEAVSNLKLLIFSGDLDKCQFADKLIKKEWATKIFFSQSAKYPQARMENLEKYCGRIINQSHPGTIKLDIK